ncbi:S-adenosylmethionine synthase [Bradyrhizobium sp. CCBAU 45394]|uniref:methionine adenosyltransferase n=1 Tax=unclassified Bradyrhizobium TaxID=2631580 RepID=UPI0023024DF1|nr:MULTISPECIES: methionine adenosyltransferase [unclassified Bradyrhizobium]MDA9391182.1 S-adenosylmethionine synthase [Bradyrhizobium sp. CCBAU 45394]MDA9540863.1 S-adenosylmethionine synthase [Bradyrhizobium sp. CCBAU 21362]
MFDLVLSQLDNRDDVEVVERKGAGHPDTICDALAETLSRNLCREYLGRFGHVLHYNVDKALLCGGRAMPTFNGGKVTDPIRILLAGWAVTNVGNEAIPVEDIAIEGSRAWLKANLHALDADRHVRIEALVHQGSQDLQSLFSRGSARQIPLANDTSFGVGHAPLSALERLVLAIEQGIHGRDRARDHPAWGEDIKIMAVRSGEGVKLTIACAMIGRFLNDMDSYLQQKAALAEYVRERASEHGFRDCEVAVNAADDAASDSIYLTVTGTSAEAGDDGQVGRGNRVNGLITPWRPMSLEAAAGKNPVSHVGKIYNILAKRVAETLVSAIPEVSAAQCLIVSRIGAPVSMPDLVHLRLATKDGVPPEELRERGAEIVSDHLGRIPELVGELVAGATHVY